jgi:hypothetical protein
MTQDDEQIVRDAMAIEVTSQDGASLATIASALG